MMRLLSPVPSPVEKGGGNLSEASNLLKFFRIAQSTRNKVNQTDNRLMTSARYKKRSWKKNGIIRIGIWNIRSWNMRNQEITAELQRCKIEICAINEMKKKGKGIIS